MTTAPELEPCLRCGGVLALHDNDWANPPLWSFHCTACALFGKEWPTRDDAVADANRRSSPREGAAVEAEAAALLAGFLACPEIADCAPEDKDPDTNDLERRTRSLLSKLPGRERP